MARSKQPKLTCPLCKQRLNIKVEGFTCHEAVHGPYLRGRVALSCSKHECRYLHTTNFQTKSMPLIEKMEDLAGKLILKLPDFGPWQVFTLAEKERRPRRRR